MKARHKRKKPESYKIRSYRQLAAAESLIKAHVTIKETDLHIQADRDVQRRAEELVLQCRLQLEEHIIRCPLFYSSLSPVAKDFTAPPLVQKMYDASRRAGVGPMAAVAGGIADFVGRTLLSEGVREIIIENGGDIFLARQTVSRVAIFAGQSPLSNAIGIELPAQTVCGVCTSSASVGHSLSIGDADSVTVVADSAYLADAVATRLGNEVANGAGKKEKVNNSLAVARTIDDITGVVVICGEVLGAVGDVKLVGIDREVKNDRDQR